jgi:hypothetical protein
MPAKTAELNRQYVKTWRMRHRAEHLQLKKKYNRLRSEFRRLAGIFAAFEITPQEEHLGVLENEVEEN